MPQGTSPPHSPEVELEVVAAMLVHDQAVPWAATLLQAGDFYLARYRVVFEALLAVHDEHQLEDVVLVTERLKEAGQWDVMGGHRGLSKILERHGYTQHLESYAAVLKAKALQRRLIDAAGDIGWIGQQDDLADEDRLQQLDQVVRSVYDEAGVSHMADAKLCISEHMAIVTEAHERDGLVGVTTGLRRLDEETGGLRPGWQVLILAGTGVGKSAMAINNLALSALRAGETVAIFALEMTRHEVIGRMVSACSGVPYHIQVRGQLDKDLDKGDPTPDRIKYEEGVRAVEQLDVHVDEGDMLTLEQLCIRSRALAHRRGRPLGMIVVDYIQLLECSAKTGSRTEELSKISRGLKRLAKELKTVVVTLSQPTAEGQRASKSGDRDLTLSDAKGSQSIGADVDLALLLNRNTDSGTIRLEAGKFRHGPSFYLTEDDLRWHGGRMAFLDR